MNIGIVCYASVGGSGVVASELARCLAERGHQTHVISSDTPFRLRAPGPAIRFHRVETPGYPLFREPQYLLALANRLVQVSRTYHLDIIHAHYAIPHAAAAYLARQILTAAGGPVPRTITTLHGTDVTILGADPSYRETVAFCIDQSDAVTAVSASLRDDTKREMPVRSAIEVIPNFLDREFHRRAPNPALRARPVPGWRKARSAHLEPAAGETSGCRRPGLCARAGTGRLTAGHRRRGAGAGESRSANQDTWPVRACRDDRRDR